MATDPLTIALVSAGSSGAASLLTVWLTPSLQHYFWKRQRLAELRIDTIDEFNRLAAEFLYEYSSAPSTYRPIVLAPPGSANDDQQELSHLPEGEPG